MERARERALGTKRKQQDEAECNKKPGIFFAFSRNAQHDGEWNYENFYGGISSLGFYQPDPRTQKQNKKVRVLPVVPV